MEKEQLRKWVTRLQVYIQKVEATDDSICDDPDVNALLGYLASLDILISDNTK